MTPCCLSRYSRSHRTWRACGSSPVVGSSSSSRSGSLISERAIVETPLHPAGQRLDPARRPLGELHEVEQLGRSPLALAAGDVEVATVDDQVLLDGELLVELIGLRHDAEAGPDLRAHVSPDRVRAPRRSPKSPATCIRSSASSTTCRHHWVRGTRTPRRGRPRRRCRRPRRDRRSASPVRGADERFGRHARRLPTACPRSGQHSPLRFGVTTAIAHGVYVPNTSRSASLTSPRVARARRASFIG